jgi:hypothetical protein
MDLIPALKGLNNAQEVDTAVKQCTSVLKILCLEFLLGKDYPDFPYRRCSAFLPLGTVLSEIPTTSCHKQEMNLSNISYRCKHTHNRMTHPYSVKQHDGFGVILLPSHVDEVEMN